VNGDVFDPNVQARGRAFNVAGPICDVIGGAAVVTGIVLYVLGHRDQERARRAGQISSAGSQLVVRF
jgi:hypothetical protein